MQRIEVVNGVDWTGVFLRETLESNGCMMSCMPPHLNGVVTSTPLARARAGSARALRSRWTCRRSDIADGLG
eukprot:COSAG02_NODE_4868_length_4881_cov_7.175659_6_plen_72_part_00